jgi:O-antigen ligase
MNSLKPLQWAGIAVGLAILSYFSYHDIHYFGDVKILGGILMLEVLIASIWDYGQRFFALTIIAFVWAGLHVPLAGVWTSGRWAVLATGAVVGFIVWSKAPRATSGTLHLIAFFCVCAGFVSATVSPFVQMASLKALSLFLLLLYCGSGARLAVLGREENFFRGLLWGSEIVVYFTAICYFGLGASIWGNPNSLGAAMSIGLFPILLWGWLVSDAPGEKFRRLAALLLCAYLIRFSMERAGMIAAGLVMVVFCVCLRQYKLLGKVGALVLIVVAVSGVVAPSSLNNQLEDMKDALLYKGHKEEGMLGSRRSPWDKSISTIKEHPWFGTGYGTSPTGEDPGMYFGTVNSSAETAREHGSSYVTIVEWVGLLGVLPFAALVAVTAWNMWKVCAWMSRTADPRHYAIPMAMVVLAGLVHAGFEDWLFAAGSYLCLFFWAFAFMLADFVPGAVEATFARVVRTSHPRPSPATLPVVVPNPVVSNRRVQ